MLVNNSHLHKKHPKRNKVKKLGSFQMDLKVLGLKETNVGEYVYIFDMIDVCGRNCFSEVLFKATTDDVTNSLIRSIDYFKSIGIEVNSIQIDNAMMFKRTNYINDNKLHKVLSDEVIKHLTIPLGEPEYIKVAERYHLKISNEATNRLKRCRTKQEVSKVIKGFMHYHDNERYHYFYEFANREIKIPYEKKIKYQLI